MKNKLLTYLIAMMAVIFAQAVNAETFRLKMQTYLSPTMSGPIETFAKNLEQMSDGRIKVALFKGGELVSATDMLRALKAGTLDIGHSSGVNYAEVTLGSIEAGLPYAWGNAWEAEYIFENKGLLELLKEEYASLGVEYLTPVYVGPYMLLTKKPVNSLEDLKKMKIRASGGTAMTLNKLGVNTVYLPTADIYLALSTNQIDGVIWGAGYEYEEMKFTEVAKYYNLSPVFDPIIDNITMSAKTWKKLPDDLKAIVRSAAAQARWGYINANISKEYEYRAKNAGNLTTLPSEDIAKLVAAATSVWADEAAKGPVHAKAIQAITEAAKLNGRL